MKPENLSRCELLIQNRKTIDKVYPFQSNILQLAAAATFIGKNQPVDEEKLRACKRLIREKKNFLSYFRSYAEIILAAKLAASENPEQLLDRAVEVYRVLKTEFWGSDYLPVAAAILAENCDPSKYEELVAEARKIYNVMRKDHPLLTSSEDVSLCALMALSDKPHEALLADAEECYEILGTKKVQSSRNVRQTLGQILAFNEGTPRVKCKKVKALADIFKERHHSFGVYYELAVLGALAMMDEDPDTLASEVIEIGDWLKGQKGFGFLSGTTSKTRMMYAGLIALQNSREAETASMNGVISAVIAEEITMSTVIFSSTISVTSSHNG